MAVTYAHGRTHATVAFSGALDRAGAAELVDVVDMLVGHYFYARLELAITSGGGDTDALEQVLGAMGRWERRQEIVERTTLSIPLLHQLIKSGRFPRRVRDRSLGCDSFRCRAAPVEVSVT